MSPGLSASRKEALLRAHAFATALQVQDSEGKEIRDGVSGRGGGYRCAKTLKTILGA